MKLKKITLIGFKSFADKTEFIFEPGVTVVVGPNGCGKSNVVDAFKWVLGEQSSKSLRGKEMTDVIFAGSSKRKALGVAEVRLVFDNSDRRLPMDFEEIEVARRLYRSGESEYLINRNLCRLRDVKELFMDTGIGMQAYSVIEQGRVAQFIQASQTERRQLFEEAAGISRYKSKRKEALAKLGRTEQNLLRVQDLVDEIERQLASVRRQAAKAEKFRVLQEEYTQKRLKLLLHEYGVFSQKIEETSAELSVCKEQEEAFRTELEAAEQEKEKADNDLLSCDAEYRNQDAQSNALTSDLDRNNYRLQVNKERLVELEDEQEANQCKLFDMQEPLRNLTAERDEAVALLTGFDANIEDFNNQIMELENRADALSQELISLVGQEKEVELSLDGHSRAFERKQGEIEGVDREREHLMARAEELSKKMEEMRESVWLHENQQGEKDKLFHQMERSQERNQKNLDRFRAKLGSQRGVISKALEELESLKLKKGEVETRLQVLASLAGEEDADLLSQLKEEEPGLWGMVSDLVTVDVGFALALEAALGTHASAWLTQDENQSLKVITALHEKGGSRKTLMTLEDTQGFERQRVPATDFHADAVWLIEQFSFAPQYQGYFEKILGDVLVVPTKAVAQTLSPQLRPWYHVVTLEGEWFGADRTLVGGPKPEVGGAIYQKSEMQHLKTELEDFNQKISLLEAQKEEAHEKASSLEQEEAKLVSEITETSIQMAGLEKEVAEMRSRHQFLLDELGAKAAEFRNAQNKVGELDQDKAQRQSELETLKVQIDEAAQKLQSFQQDLEAKRQQQEAARDEVGQIRMDRVKLEEEKSSAEKARGMAEESLQRLHRDLAEIKEDSRQMVGREKELVTENGSLEQLSEELKAKSEEVKAVLETLTKQRDDLIEVQRAKQHVINEIRPQQREAEDKLHKLDMELEKAKLKCANHEERAQEELGLSLASCYACYFEDPEFDWKSFKGEVKELKARMDKMGNVNLDAIQEEKDTQERARFMAEQMDDLKNAKGTLEDLILRINETCKQKFIEAFYTIKENFKQTFRKLFGGGAGDVMLTDEEDVLECGIDIVARPPGKEPRSITLLSGGEKTMTAVALLFAVFRSKPSPFCILDEVDAALDEANIDRFLSMLREFLDQSQFLIITHNKRTMRVGDAIYGITQQEKGVSTHISVRFEDVEKEIQVA